MRVLRYCGCGSKERPRTFGCIPMGRALLCILGPDCSYILQGLGVNRVHVVLSRQKLYVGMVVYIVLAALVLVWM